MAPGIVTDREVGDAKKLEVGFLAEMLDDLGEFGRAFAEGFCRCSRHGRVEARVVFGRV